MTGILVGTFAVSVWAYSIRAVKQDTFEDVDEEAKAMLSSRTQQEHRSEGESAPAVVNVQAVAAAVTDSATKISSDSRPSPPGLSQAAEPPVLEGRLPRSLDPHRKTLVWGAPPVDRVGRLSDRST